MSLPHSTGSHGTSPIARWRGEFVSARMEAAFLRQQGAAIKRDLCRAQSFCAAFYIAFALTDVAALGYGMDAMLLFLARTAVAIVALAGVVLTRRSRDGARTAYRAATAATGFGMATFLLVVALRPSDVLLHGMSMAIMLVIVYLFIPNRLVTAMTVALGATTGFLALALILGTLTPDRILSMAMLLLLSNLFGATAALRSAHLWREQYVAQQTLTNLSMRDALTGAFNRRHLNAGLLDQELDTYGHQAGDTLLQAFAGLLLALTRDGIDTVVRYGGEEFLLILPGTTLDQGHALAERMRATFAGTRTRHGATELAATASFGVVSAPLSPQQPAIASHALIAQADELMYAAKRGGRNQVRITERDAAEAA
jgi:diguanylate cyclase (GGDEF)-like protein